MTKRNLIILLRETRINLTILHQLWGMLLIIWPLFKNKDKQVMLWRKKRTKMKKKRLFKQFKMKNHQLPRFSILSMSLLWIHKFNLSPQPVRLNPRMETSSQHFSADKTYWVKLRQSNQLTYRPKFRLMRKLKRMKRQTNR